MKRTKRRRISKGTYRRKCLLFLIVFLLPICVHLSYPSANQRKHILVLHSYHKGQEWNDAITQGIESVFDDTDQEIELYFEYMDTKR